MNITDNFRKTIVSEFRYVAEKMREEKQSAQKLYFFSAAYGVVFRIINLEFDPTLVFIHNVLQHTHVTINSMALRIEGKEERVIQIPEKVFESLVEALEELSNKIEIDTDVSPTLQRISNIAYVTTGNGYYLYQKGIPKI